jgi:hypothetical protein
MPERIAAFLASKPPAECERLLANAYKYIHNAELLNLLEGFSCFNHKKNMKFKNQLHMFSDIPNLKEMVDEWMNS